MTRELAGYFQAFLADMQVIVSSKLTGSTGTNWENPHSRVKTHFGQSCKAGANARYHLT